MRFFSFSVKLRINKLRVSQRSQLSIVSSYMYSTSDFNLYNITYEREIHEILTVCFKFCSIYLLSEVNEADKKVTG